MGKPAQAEGQRYAAHPGEAAVKQEGDHGLAAGAEGEIGGVGIRIEGHHDGAQADQTGGKMPHFLCGIVNLGEYPGD